jgi:hypothetical protein
MQRNPIMIETNDIQRSAKVGLNVVSFVPQFNDTTVALQLRARASANVLQHNSVTG